MLKFAANLSMMFTEWAFLDRFGAAADAGVAARCLARSVRVVAGLAAGAKVAPHHPQIRTIGDGLDVVNHVRRC